MNLLTLEFEQPEIEAAYCIERFARTSGAVIVVSAVNIALHTILTAAVPQLLCILAPGLSFWISLFGLRLYAKRIAPQRGLLAAHVFFCKGLFLSGLVVTLELSVVKTVFAFACSPLQFILASSLYFMGFTCFRLIAIMPRQRLCLACCVSLSWCAPLLGAGVLLTCTHTLLRVPGPPPYERPVSVSRVLYVPEAQRAAYPCGPLLYVRRTSQPRACRTYRVPVAPQAARSKCPLGCAPARPLRLFSVCPVAPW